MLWNGHAINVSVQSHQRCILVLKNLVLSLRRTRSPVTSLRYSKKILSTEFSCCLWLLPSSEKRGRSNLMSFALVNGTTAVFLNRKTRHGLRFMSCKNKENSSVVNEKISNITILYVNGSYWISLKLLFRGSYWQDNNEHFAVKLIDIWKKRMTQRISGDQTVTFV